MSLCVKSRFISDKHLIKIIISLSVCCFLSDQQVLLLQYFYFLLQFTVVGSMISQLKVNCCSEFTWLGKYDWITHNLAYVIFMLSCSEQKTIRHKSIGRVIILQLDWTKKTKISTVAYLFSYIKHIYVCFHKGDTVDIMNLSRDRQELLTICLTD